MFYRSGLPFLIKWDILKSITETTEWLTMLFFFILSKCTPSNIFFFSSSEGDKARKLHSLSSSRPVSWKQRDRDKGKVPLTTYDQPLETRNYRSQVFVEHVMEFIMALFLLPPAVHMVIPGSKHHLRNTIHAKITSYLCSALMILLSRDYVPTFSFHESVEEAAPVSGIRLSLVHTIKVIIWDHVVFGIASHIDHLPKLKHLGFNMAWCILLSKCLQQWVKKELFNKAFNLRTSSCIVPCFCKFYLQRHTSITHKLLTLLFCSQKDFGTSWTGRWVLIRRGEVVRFSASWTPTWPSEVREWRCEKKAAKFSNVFLKIRKRTKSLDFILKLKVCGHQPGSMNGTFSSKNGTLS